MSNIDTDLSAIIKAEFGRGKGEDRIVTVRGALERTLFIDGVIRRTINRITNRAQRADMIGAVDPDDIKEGLDHLVAALNAINKAWESFESAAEVWGVTEDMIAEIVNAAGGRIGDEPLQKAADKREEISREMLVADDPKQIAPEDVPGFPFK